MIVEQVFEVDACVCAKVLDVADEGVGSQCCQRLWWWAGGGAPSPLSPYFFVPPGLITKRVCDGEG